MPMFFSLVYGRHLHNSSW